MTERTLRFRWRQHLRRRCDFQRIFKRRCVVSRPVLVVHVDRNDLGYTRLGISTPRSVGRAVARNRLRRLIREAFRLRQRDLPEGLDIVCVAKPNPTPTLSDYIDVLPNLVRTATTKLNRR